MTYTDVLPDISVTKTADPTSVPETGGSVTFTYTVTNNSTEAATITVLSDDKVGTLIGDADCQVGTVLAGGASCSFEAMFAIPAGDYPGSHVNVFTATVSDDDNNTDTATDDATVDYTDVAPDIKVIKTADPTHVPETGGDVTFTFVVQNIGPEAVTLTSLVDNRFLDLNGQGTCATGGLIPVDGSYTCQVTKHLSGDSLTPHVNIVTAVGTDDDGTTDTATDNETVTFDDVTPLTISKTASTSLKRTYNWTITKGPDTEYHKFVGDPASTHQYTVNVDKTTTDSNWAVTGTISIQNSSIVPATIPSVNDVISGDIIASVDCGVTFPYTLAAGATLSCNYGASVPDGADRTNTVTVTATEGPQGGTATAPVNFAGASITEIGYPSINVSDTNGQ